MITVVFNREKPCREVVAQLSRRLKQKKLEHQLIGRWPFTPADRKAIQQANLLIVIGGDGTVLSAASAMHRLTAPVLPVNFGTLGFISSVAVEDALRLAEKLADGAGPSDGSWQYDDRPVLEVRLGGRTWRAVNEMVLRAEGSGKLLRIETGVNGAPLTSFRADGVIVATATGSTAYNLAAGGPILHPGIEAFIFNPICPHSLSLKPLVLPGRDRLTMAARSPKGERVRLWIDGQSCATVPADADVEAGLAPEKLRIVKPAGESYYRILTEKMHWGA